MCSREGFEEVVRKSSSGWHGGGKGGRFEEGWCRAPSQTVPSAGRVSGGSWYPRSLAHLRLANQLQLTSGNSEGTLVARDERTDLPFRLPLSLVLRLARAQFE